MFFFFFVFFFVVGVVDMAQHPSTTRELYSPKRTSSLKGEASQGGPWQKDKVRRGEFSYRVGITNPLRTDISSACIVENVMRATVNIFGKPKGHGFYVSSTIRATV